MAALCATLRESVVRREPSVPLAAEVNSYYTHQLPKCFSSEIRETLELELTQAAPFESPDCADADPCVALRFGGRWAHASSRP